LHFTPAAQVEKICANHLAINGAPASFFSENCVFQTEKATSIETAVVPGMTESSAGVTSQESGCWAVFLFRPPG
jgi:hypothetical protein